MKIISDDQIKNINIQPTTCLEWIKSSFLCKKDANLPPKISMHLSEGNFFNTMPCLLPNVYNSFGVKVVSRIKSSSPILKSEILLYNASTGDLLAILDGNWITAMRTGAVSTLAIQTFRKQNVEQYGFLGLGNTARATLLCLLDSEQNIKHKVALLKYKDQAELFINRFSNYRNVEFCIVDTIEELIETSDVVISCITEANDLLCKKEELFRKGCLLVPVHTKGFQNCDLFFDKVFSDDTAHVSNFKYFNKFKSYAEISDVLLNRSPGRESDEERIISYNIGLGLHDVYFAYNIYNILKDNIDDVVGWSKVLKKFWL